MVAHVKLSALRQGRPYEYVVRFALGGFATVAAGLVADWAGPAAGGLMLAFPAVFCASATLIEKHERERKHQKGLRAGRRGKGAAALDAAGAGWSSVGMAAFALMIWWLAPRLNPARPRLAAASLIWFAVAVCCGGCGVHCLVRHRYSVKVPDLSSALSAGSAFANSRSASKQN